ncbi:unnamed protein product, partial [Polarella glacialis]
MRVMPWTHFCFAACVVALARCADLREVFRERQCLPEEGRPLFSFGGKRRWVFELNNWSSQRVVTTIAAILLREHAGYTVDLNQVASASRAYHRAAKDWANPSGDGQAVAEWLAAGNHFGYANMEAWPATKAIEDFFELENLVVRQKRLIEAGPIGYDGRSGWYVAESFALRPEFPLPPDFY